MIQTTEPAGSDFTATSRNSALEESVEAMIESLKNNCRLNAPTLREEEPSVTEPLVSVIMPVYNGARWIRAAIRSVLLQTWDNLELIVVDDGSTDATPEILDSFGNRLTVIRQNRRNNASARNAGILAASGDWIAMIDADDTWHPEKLACQLEMAQDADVIYTAAFNFEDVDRVEPVTFSSTDCPSGDVFEHLLENNFITHSSALIRRSALLTNGAYDVSLNTTCDWDLWLRMAAAGCRFRGTPLPLTNYRWRRDSISRNHDATCHDRVGVLQRALRQPRALKIPRQARLRAMARVWQTSAWFVADNDDSKALLWYLNSVTYRPYSLRAWKEIARCLLHLCGISRRRLRAFLNQRATAEGE